VAQLCSAGAVCFADDARALRPSHNAIVLSRFLDRVSVLAWRLIRFFHEMLHLRFPVEHRGARRCVHTRDFKQAEMDFPRLRERSRF